MILKSSIFKPGSEVWMYPELSERTGIFADRGKLESCLTDQRLTSRKVTLQWFVQKNER